MSPHDLACKLTKVNLSDIAAMGGVPDFALLGIALPEVLPTGWLEAFSEGLRQTFRDFGLSLIGGDTSLSPGPVMVSMTLLGTCPHYTPVLRHAPRPGDTLYVSGPLGDAALGLALLDRTPGNDISVRKEDRSYLLRRHLDPSPRLKLGQAIAQQGIATVMIDISDGLIGDLSHLLEGTSLGAWIEWEKIPLSPPFRKVSSHIHPHPEQLVFSGGEDYELLLASPYSVSRINEMAPDIGHQLTAIGRITETPGLTILKSGTPLPVKTGGYRHQFHQKGAP